MSVVSLLCFLVCLGVVISCFRRGADTLSPARVFGFMWALALGLTELKLSGLQHTWTMESWVLLLVGVFAFLLGILIAFTLNLGRPVLSIAAIRSTQKGEGISERRLFACIGVVFGLYVLAYLAIVIGKGVLPPLFSPKPWIARREFTMFGLGLFLHNVVIVAFFSVMYFIAVEGHRLKKFLVVGMTLVSMVTYFFLLQRLQIMMVGVLCAALLYYTSSHLRRSTMTLYFLAACLFFYVVSSLRAGQLIIDYLYVASAMKFAPAYAIFTEPYMYFVMNLENFARSVARLDTFTYGYYTLDFATALIGLKHWISEYFSLVENPYLISAYNTYTSLWTYYRDFGVPGITVIPILLGWGIGTIYYWMRRRPTLSAISCYSVAVFVLFISFFNSPIGFLWFVYNLVAMYVILRIVRTRRSPEVVPAFKPAPATG